MLVKNLFSYKEKEIAMNIYSLIIVRVHIYTVPMTTAHAALYMYKTNETKV